MKLTKNDKIELAKKLGDEFKAKDVFFASFQGLKFKDINNLKNNLRPAKSKFKVMRNTVVSHAISNAALKSDDDKVAKGPTAVITVDSADDIAKAARALLAFAREKPALKIKGGFAFSKWLTPQDLEKLSKIGSRAELLAQLAGVLYSNLAQIRWVLEAPAMNLVYALEAVKEKAARKA
ncbi:MAG: 50S ribosomal protein L10 [Elusimicrobia bacterium]|nr:50S ribosomal protein L10 [Elusimicrobiota bacterium]